MIQNKSIYTVIKFSVQLKQKKRLKQAKCKHKQRQIVSVSKLMLTNEMHILDTDKFTICNNRFLPYNVV